MWNEENGYVSNVTSEHADRYFDELKLSEKSNVDKNNRIKALKMLFKWRSQRRGSEAWDTHVSFKTEQTSQRDFLRKAERGKIRQASLEFGSVPSYQNLSPDESAKNRDNWNPVLTQKTQKVLKRWLQQCSAYEDSSLLWLTREGNPYGSSSLKYLLTQLAEEAGMDTENRGFHWYMIRHSTGTYTTHDVSEKAAQAQLRHKSGKSTQQYDQAPPELRRKGLEEIG